MPIRLFRILVCQMEDCSRRPLPDRSVIVRRMTVNDAHQMNPYRNSVDQVGVSMIRDWIGALKDCSAPNADSVLPLLPLFSTPRSDVCVAGFSRCLLFGQSVPKRDKWTPWAAPIERRRPSDCLARGLHSLGLNSKRRVPHGYAVFAMRCQSLWSFWESHRSLGSSKTSA